MSTLTEATTRLLRDRMMILRLVRHLGTATLSCVCGLLLVQALAPIATALATIELVGRLTAHRDATAALAALLVVLLVGQVVDHFVDPLYYLTLRRIDGAHRREVAAVACAPDGVAHL